MNAAVAVNRLSKVAKVRASAQALALAGDRDGARTLRQAASRNESEVLAAIADHPERATILARREITPHDRTRFRRDDELQRGE